jgi:hypothetical protein
VRNTSKLYEKKDFKFKLCHQLFCGVKQLCLAVNVIKFCFFVNNSVTK